MKTKILRLLFVLVLCVSLIGCGDRNAEQPDISQSSAINDVTTTVTTSDVTTSSTFEEHSLLKSYKGVLLSEDEFFSVQNKKKMVLNDFLTDKEALGAVYTLTHFTIVGMDDDLVPEVVLELSRHNEPEAYIILHDDGNMVYGHMIYIRSFQQLKTDGSFIFSSGAADSGSAKISFDADTLKTDILGYSQSSQGDTGITISYTIGDKPVTKEDFNQFIKEQTEKEDVTWQEFSPINIDTAFA